MGGVSSRYLQFIRGRHRTEVRFQKEFLREQKLQAKKNIKRGTRFEKLLLIEFNGHLNRDSTSERGTESNERDDDL